jgi:hypothetical protein
MLYLFVTFFKNSFQAFQFSCNIKEKNFLKGKNFIKNLQNNGMRISVAEAI